MGNTDSTPEVNHQSSSLSSSSSSRRRRTREEINDVVEEARRSSVREEDCNDDNDDDRSSKRPRTNSITLNSSSSSIMDPPASSSADPAAAGNYRNDDDYNNNEDDAEMRLLSDELAEAETMLTQQRSVLFGTAQDQQQAGQSIYDSIGSALGSIRNRLYGMSSSITSSVNGGTETTIPGASAPSSSTEPQASSAAATGSTATTGTGTGPSSLSASANPVSTPAGGTDGAIGHRRSSLSALSRRLETAERSHSTRVPLQYIQSGLSRRELDYNQDDQSYHSAPPDPEAGGRRQSPPVPTGVAVDRSVSEDGRLKDDGESDISEDGGTSLTSPSTTRPRRRGSMLVASRRRSDIHDRAELELHESVVGSRRPSTILEARESNISSSTSIRLSNASIEVDHQNVTEESSKINDEGLVNEEQGVEVELLLPESTREQLGAAQNHMQLTSSLKIFSHSSSTNLFKESNEAAATVPEASIEQPSSTSEHDPLYTWGSIDFETVGDGGDTASSGTYSLFGRDIDMDKTELASPQKLPEETRLGRSNVVSASISETHIVFCTSTGRMIGCGDNTNGALDPSQRTISPIIARPIHLEVLAMQKVLQVACGRNHTCAITENRSVLSWGSNDQNQLGHRLPPSAKKTSTNQVRSPAMVQFKGRASDVQCGNGFTLILTTRMQVFMCGKEEISGFHASTSQGLSQLPQEHPALIGLPLVFIAAGDSHAIALTAHGTSYAWGDNSAGQCGRMYPTRVKVPVPIKLNTSFAISNRSSGIMNWDFFEEDTSIRLADDVNIVHATCGANFTVLVSKTGNLLVCGSNATGQLGIPVTDSSKSITSAEEVKHPLPSRKFVSAEAGANYTLILDDAGSIYRLGGGAEGAVLEFDSSSASSVDRHLFVGGSTNFVIEMNRNKVEKDNKFPTLKAIPGLDNILESIRKEQEGTLQTVMGALQKVIPALSNRSLVEDLCDRTRELFRNPPVMNSLFMDPMEIENLYAKLIVGDHSHDVKQQIVTAMEEGMIHALESMQDARLMYPESVRFLLQFLQCPLFREPKEDSGHDDTEEKSESLTFDARGKLLLSLCEAILGLPFEGYKAFIEWAISVYGEQRFVPFLVRPLVVQLNNRVEQERTLTVPAIAGVLRWFENVANHSEKDLARPEDFYCDGIEELPLETLYEDLYRYSSSSKVDRATHFYLSANSFLFSPQLKRNLLQIENQLTMVHAAQSGGVNFDPRTREFQFQPYFVLTLDRQYLLQQTLQAVAQASPRDLKKSLKVVFKGEDGVDAGGVTREFFMLLIQQLFDVNTGMWTTRFGDGHDTWFNSDCTWNDDGYYLTGVLFGLALYNGVLLDVHFPAAVYRKLLGLPLGLEDMVDEEVRKGLQQLLDYDGDDVEDIFCLNFEVTWMDLGVERKRELKPGGAEIAVTSENKEEYTLAYVKWILVDSIAQQYDEFERGFMAVTAPENAGGASSSRFQGTLDLLRPEELELLVVGTRELDFSSLEKSAQYEGGFDKESAVVKNLWRFVKSADPAEQVRFLVFTTGSRKAPIGGLGNLSFLVQRAGPDSMQLPTSHTCFNTLLLPDYGDNYEKLADRLSIAIRECQGFGLQ